ncbi:MAG: helix-turn-helix domain-containing protein [Saprospiraceae bacterium]|nr:helix-turn-helix domain-containing protein [Pyrinomonadaceae bacterium]
MDVLTTKQASEILGVSRRRIIALIEQGKLKAGKFANVYTIAQKDLDAVRKRTNGRPTEKKNGDAAIENDKPFKTIFDLAPDLIGSIKSGLPTDLSCNKEYRKDIGKKSAEKKALENRKRLSEDE